MEIMDSIFYAKQKKYNYGGKENEKADVDVGADYWNYSGRPE